VRGKFHGGYNMGTLDFSHLVKERLPLFIKLGLVAFFILQFEAIAEQKKHNSDKETPKKEDAVNEDTERATNESQDEDLQKREEQKQIVEAVEALLKAGAAVKGEDGDPTPFGNFIRLKGSAFLFIDEPAKLKLQEAIKKVREAETEVERNIAIRGATAKIATGSSDFAIVAYNPEKQGWYYADLTKSLKGGSAGVKAAVDNPAGVADAQIRPRNAEGLAAYVRSGRKRTGQMLIKNEGGTPSVVFKPIEQGKQLRLRYDSTKKKLISSWE